jgi:protein ImuB
METLFACIHAPGNLALAIECARGFSPYIEEDPPDTVVFDARGLESLYGPPDKLAREIDRRIGVKASIAIAANPDTAIHAAHGIPGITVIALGREAETLAHLPVNLLSAAFPERVSSQTAELLHLWGVRTFGEFAQLPPLGVAARIGDEGVHLQRLARGESHRQLRPIVDPLEFQEELELDDVVESIEPLAFIVSRLLNDVCARLAVHSLATNEIHLRLLLERAPDHTVTLKLPVPMLDAKAFLKMLHLDLNARPPAAPVLKVALKAEPVKPRRTQHGLFVPSSPEPEKLELTISRLRHLVGEEKVGTPEQLNTHRPDSFNIRRDANRLFSSKAARWPAAEPGPQLIHGQVDPVSMPVVRPHVDAVAVAEMPLPAPPRLCLRRFRPPRLAQVIVVNHQPVRIASQSISGRIVMAKGPWRTSGEWWESDPWNRDEWDVALESGAIYRLFQDSHTVGHWFIEGSYD